MTTLRCLIRNGRKYVFLMKKWPTVKFSGTVTIFGNFGHFYLLIWKRDTHTSKVLPKLMSPQLGFVSHMTPSRHLGVLRLLSLGSGKVRQNYVTTFLCYSIFQVPWNFSNGKKYIIISLFFLGGTLRGSTENFQSENNPSNCNSTFRKNWIRS